MKYSGKHVSPKGQGAIDVLGLGMGLDKEEAASTKPKEQRKGRGREEGSQGRPMRAREGQTPLPESVQAGAANGCRMLATLAPPPQSRTAPRGSRAQGTRCFEHRTECLGLRPISNWLVLRGPSKVFIENINLSSSGSGIDFSLEIKPICRGESGSLGRSAAQASQRPSVAVRSSAPFDAPGCQTRQPKDEETAAAFSMCSFPATTAPWCACCRKCTASFVFSP